MIADMKDAAINQLLVKEEKRQKSVINLIASENYVSKDVREALGSVLTNKYAEGYPGKRYYGGNEFIDQVERLCQERALKLFGLSPNEWHVNVQPYSGSPANFAVYYALIPPYGKIMGMRLDHGGHLTHGHKVSATGSLWHQVGYGVDPKTERLNYIELEKIAQKEKPDIVVAGFTAYSRIIDFKKMKNVARAAGTILMVDASHFAGLIAGGSYPSPFPYADIVTMTTHKTLRGPRGAMIFVRKSPGTTFAEKIDKAIFPGLQGGPHMNTIAAMGVALKEAATPAFQTYAKQVVKNAQTLAQELQKKGWRIISGGTDSHVFLVDTMSRGIPGKIAQERLEQKGIVVNKNTIPFDIRSPFDPSGIRIGTAAVTTQGMKEKDMKRIATTIDKILS
jgi:glycine hydroxymethyltransferase